jgi:hypothetical protein
VGLTLYDIWSVYNLALKFKTHVSDGDGAFWVSFSLVSLLTVGLIWLAVKLWRTLSSH